MRWFNEMQRLSASPENAVKLQQVFASIDVRDLLPQVTVPTLVLHSRDDQAIPFAAGKEIADGIPGAPSSRSTATTTSCSRRSRRGRRSSRSCGGFWRLDLLPYRGGGGER